MSQLVSGWRCWSCAWSHDSLSHGIDKMADPVMLSIFGVCPSRCDIYARSAMVSVLPPGIDLRKLQRSHSEISRVEPLSGLPSRLFFGLPSRFSVFTQTLSDLTLDRSVVLFLEAVVLSQVYVAFKISISTFCSH